MLRTWGWQGRPCETPIRESSQMSGSYFSGRNPQTFDVAWKVLRESCPTLAAVINFTAPNKHQWEAYMRRAFIILLMSATLGISLQSTTPASAAPERFCAKWLYGASLQREAWGGCVIQIRTHTLLEMGVLGYSSTEPICPVLRCRGCTNGPIPLGDAKSATTSTQSEAYKRKII